MEHNKKDICLYLGISHLIVGIIYFKYLNSISDCACVNKSYVANIKKYFYLLIIFFAIYCLDIKNTLLQLICNISITFCNVMFIKNVWLLLSQINKDNCECANSNLKTLIYILNTISIVFYSMFIVVLVFFIISMISSYKSNMNLNDLNDNETYNEILVLLNKKNMRGGSIEKLANKYLGNQVFLKKIYDKLID